MNEKKINVRRMVRANTEQVARVIYYLLKQGNYHRKNTCRALVVLLAEGTPYYRSVGWALLQMMPLSHLLEVSEVVVNPNRENNRRLRQALVYKLAHSSREEIFRAYFMAPGKYRKLFKYFRLPTEKIKGQIITNENYKLAVSLSRMSITKTLARHHLTATNLVSDFKIPLHMVFHLVTTPEEAMTLAKDASADDFFRHARWFRETLGDAMFNDVALEKLAVLKNPLAFLQISDHLLETRAMTDTLMQLLEEKTEKLLQSIMKESKIQRLALIVDVSSSMIVARDITVQLHELFTRLGKTITDIIAFNNVAFEVPLSQLRELQCSGMTSIGSAFVLLAKRLQSRTPDTHPEVIILVSDLEENTPPYLNDSVKLLQSFGYMPIVILHCSSSSRNAPRIDHPHALITVRRFHHSQMVSVFREIAKLTSQVKEEKKITTVVRSRRPLEEIIGELQLPQRPEETLKAGYLLRLLTTSSSI